MKKTNLSLALSFSVIGAIHSQERPNILWLTYEDISPQFVGCYGNEAAITPAMDTLANSVNGVRFNYAFSNSTVSSPSRSCIITGMDVNVIGTGNHRYIRTIPSEIKGFPYYLKQAGYYTTNNVKTDYNIKNTGFNLETWSESSGTAHWRKRPATGTPFFSVFNINHSHQSYTTQGSFKYYMDEVFNKMENQYKSSKDEVIIPPFYRTDDEMKELICRIQNCVNYTDQQVAERIRELKSDGLDENTIIFVFADHGQGMPRGKTCAIGLGYRVPFIVWFPDKWKHLNPFAQNVVNDTQICFEDLAPTVLKLAGVEVPERMKGIPFLGEGISESRKYIYGSRNRVGESPGIERSVMKGKFIYTRVFSPYLPTVKKQGYDYNCDILKHVRKHTYFGNLNTTQLEPFQPRQTEYLYNLETDPWEINNLADNVEHKIILNELRNEMLRYAKEIKDIGFMPEYEMQRRSGETTSYEVRNNNYDIEKILEVAMLVGGGNAVLPAQLTFLTDADPLIRYWAALGIYNQGINAELHKETIEQALENETFEGVRIELAAFLFKYCQVDSSVEILKEYAIGTNDLLATTAILKFQEFGDELLKFKEFIREVQTYWKTNDVNYCALPAINVTQIIINDKLDNPISNLAKDNEVYQLKNTITGGYLCVKQMNILNEKTVQTLIPTQNAIWYFKKQTEKEYYIQTEGGQYALEIPDGGTNNNISPEVRSFTGSVTQLWTLEPYQYGYRIINKQTGKGIQVNSQSKNEGTVISQWDYNGSPHFVWKLEKQDRTETGITELDGNNSNITYIYPNPISKGQTLQVSLTLHEATEYSIQLYDLKGKKMIEKQYPMQIPGEYVITIPIISQEIPNGQYVVVLQTKNSRSQQQSQSKILIIK